MAIKRPSRAKPKGKGKPPSTLQNLAAPPGADDSDDEQLVDHSGVFRVTANIARAQIGRDDDGDPPRFASDSLVMAAQRDGFRAAAGPTLDDVVEDVIVEDEAAALLKRQRLEMLAARARTRRRP